MRAAAAIVLLCVPAGIAGISQQPARAADVAPLRTLRYAVEVSIKDRRETQGGGIAGTRPGMEFKGHVVGGGNPTRGDGDSTAGVAVSAKGAIAVDVVAATDDMGLIVDVAEDAPSRTHAKVRVAIPSRGELLFDPKRAADVSEEERALLHWLARGFFSERSATPGTYWTVDESGEGRIDVERYRVLSSDQHRVTLNYELEEKGAGSEGFAGRRTGSLVYDTALVVPVKASFDEEAHRTVDGGFDTLRSQFAFELTADSFAGKR